jgi:hypothetical protein
MQMRLNNVAAGSNTDTFAVLNYGAEQRLSTRATSISFERGRRCIHEVSSPYVSSFKGNKRRKNMLPRHKMKHGSTSKSSKQTPPMPSVMCAEPAHADRYKY